MSGLQIASIILITLALVFYSVGVWAERLRRYLLSWHVAAFWAGFCFDITGTGAMELMSPGFNWASLHTITGQIALWLMLAHAAWATRVVCRDESGLRRRFHRYSLLVWCVWLVPYIGGMILGMRG
jgi:uncharacterized repeat protein (TIGR03987 family)